MCYSEYISAGGTNETLIAALDEFFRGGESAARRVICQDNDERNQILRALAEYSSLMLGFSIDRYEGMDWNGIYYDKTLDEIHSGRINDQDFASYHDNIMHIESFYTAILGDMAIDVVELPDIMTLFGSVY